MQFEETISRQINDTSLAAHTCLASKPTSTRTEHHRVMSVALPAETKTDGCCDASDLLRDWISKSETEPVGSSIECHVCAKVRKSNWVEKS